MLACAFKAVQEIMGGAELLCHILEMTEVEPAVQPFSITCDMDTSMSTLRAAGAM